MLMPELKPVPSPEWQAEWGALMADPWLRRKTDRARRMAEHQAYVDKYLPEIKTSSPGLVIDIGPGCGELLEIAQQHGHAAIGVDAPNGAGGMGDAYLKSCRLMHQRQGLNVEYMDALGWFARNRPSNVVAISARGSIEQVFARYMDGEPHDRHHNCRLLEWRFDNATHCAMRAMFRTIADMLRPDGILMIHANGAKNSSEYDKQVQIAAGEFLTLLHTEPFTIHKWGKNV